MKDTIHTLFHHLTPGNYPEIFRSMQAAPKFVFGGDVVEFLAKNYAWSSMAALVEMGLARLPHREILVEYSANKDIRWFILLKEQPDGGAPFMVQSLFYDIPGKRIFLEADKGEVVMNKHSFDAYEFGQKQGAHAAIVAITASLFLSNLQGIERQHIVPKPSFNAARAIKGKPRVPNYTYVRIGTVYDRDGNAINAIGGGAVRMHLRRAYTRRQHHGPGNSLIKTVLIPPCIVNYSPDEEMIDNIKKVRI